MGRGERQLPEPGHRRRPRPHGPEPLAGPRSDRRGQPLLGPHRAARHLRPGCRRAQRGDHPGRLRRPRQPREQRDWRLAGLRLLLRPQPGRRGHRRLRARGEGRRRGHRPRRSGRRRGDRRPHAGHQRLRARPDHQAVPADHARPRRGLRRRRVRRPAPRRLLVRPRRPPLRRRAVVAAPRGHHDDRLGPALVHHERRLLPLPAPHRLEEGDRRLDRPRRLPAQRRRLCARCPRGHRRRHDRPADRAPGDPARLVRAGLPARPGPRHHRHQRPDRLQRRTRAPGRRPARPPLRQRPLDGAVAVALTLYGVLVPTSWRPSATPSR